MKFHVFKFSEAENGHYFLFISPFNGDNIDLVSESIEHYISNELTPMNQYLNNIDFSTVKVEKVQMNPIDVINKSFQPDEKNMLISSSFVSLKPLPPPPKVKKAPKPKADKPVKEKKEPKQRAKKGTQNVQISTEPVIVDKYRKSFLW